MHAARVAIAASVVVVACYTLCILALNHFVSHRLTAEADSRLSGQLASVGRLDLGTAGASRTGSASPTGNDLDDVPIFVWRVSAHGSALPLTAGAPALPRRVWTSVPVTLDLGAIPFRLAAERRLLGMACDGYFIDIGLPQTLARADKELPAWMNARNAAPAD